MKRLSDILYRCGLLEVQGSTAIKIRTLHFDSRQVGRGDLFVAVRGTGTDGHLFIEQAIAKGATAIICEQPPEKVPQGVCCVKVSNSAIALAQAASNFFDNPSEKLSLVGVTGTNGKTTTVTLLFEAFRNLGYGAGMLSTVETRINETVLPATHTTPDAITINRLLHDMVEAGCAYAFMEVSSHALDQERVSGLAFAGGIFSNITHDHLDYHKTFAAYLKAKKKFFDNLPSKAFALVNADDRNAGVMTQNTKARTHTFGLHTYSEFRAKILEPGLCGTLLSVDEKEVWSPLSGEFNAYNFLAVYAAGVLLGQEAADVLIVLSQSHPVEGRFESLASPHGVTALVDYAHTPDAVMNVLNTIDELRTHNEKVITVIGAGGDRDRTKRPEMARIACNLSDTVILTSDNPRSEDPAAIIEEMQNGLDPVARRKILTIVNRKEAILAACHMARQGDIILVAGKGHEKYQEINGVRYPFDDKKILEEYLEIQIHKNEP